MRSKTADGILKHLRTQVTPYFIDILGFHLQIDEGVYPPIEESVLLSENLKSTKYGIKENEHALDYGCGSGFQSMVCASLGGTAVAIDINPFAVKCARKNVVHHHLENRVELRQGKNFEPILSHERFDVVIASLPFENAEPFDDLEYAVYDYNFEMRKTLFSNIQEHLTENGRIFYTYSHRVQKSLPLENSSKGFTFNVIDQRNVNGESYLLFLIKPK